MKKAMYIVLPVVICCLVGFIASLFQKDAMVNWYPYLQKPLLTPPDMVFPIAWTFLYICMGVSIGLILLSHSLRKKPLVILFCVQLLFNFAWSILFFYFRSPWWGLVDIVLLDGCVTAYAIRSYPVKKASSILFWPYILWVYFATYLNGYIFLYN